MVDIVKVIVDNYDSGAKLGHGFEHAADQVERFACLKAGTVSDVSHRNPFLHVQDSASVADVCALLADGGHHRVTVFHGADSARENLVNIITQFSVVTYLSQNLAQLGAVAHKTIGELHLGHAPVLTVQASQKVIEALHTIIQHRVSGVPIVDDNNAILGNISASDARSIALYPAHIYRLDETLRAFLVGVHDSDVDERTPSFVCTEHTTLSEVISRLSTLHIHRLYVVNAHGSPVRAITLRDVLHAILHN